MMKIHIRWLTLVASILTMILFTACSSGSSGDDDDSGSADDDSGADDDNDDDSGDDDSSSDDDDDSSPPDDDSADDDTSATTCLIEGNTYNAGDTNSLNVCLVCDPEESTTNWTMNDGAACDDGVYCNGADVCLGGMCSVHNGNPCPDDGQFCNGEESCDEVNNECTAPYDPCGTDETCQESTDFCEPTAGTCHGAAYSTQDLCEYDLQDYHGAFLTKNQVEVWCDNVEDAYGKSMNGVYFTCLDDCAREQSCSVSCMDACATASDPGGSGCDHVMYELYDCGLVFLIEGTDFIYPMPDAQNVCDTVWSYDWSCVQSCYDDYSYECGTGYLDQIISCINTCD